MSIYIEYYFLENFLIDYIIIDTVSTVLNENLNKKRGFLGALIGGLYSMVYFYQDLIFLYNILFKMIFIMIIVYIVYGFKNLKSYIKFLAVFFIVNMVICGSIFFTIYFTGISHINMSFIIYGAFISSKFIDIMYKSIKIAKITKNVQEEISIKINDNIINFNALLDTGNLLVDPIGKKPVIIVDVRKLEDILPKDALFINYDDMDAEKLEFISKHLSDEIYARFRIIPYSVIGNKQKILIGLKTDYIQIKGEKKQNIIIGLSNFSKEKEYNAILNPNLV